MASWLVFISGGKMETLYEINERYRAALQMYEDGVSELVDTETGEIIPIEDWLAALQMSKEEKIDNTIKKALESGVELAGCSIVENKTLSY